jgi:hypothetical protein
MKLLTEETMRKTFAFFAIAVLLPAMPGFAVQAPPAPTGCPEPFTRQFDVTDAITLAAEKAYAACVAMQAVLTSASQNWDSVNRITGDILNDRVRMPAKKIDNSALLYVEAARDLPAAENRFRESSILADNLFWDRRVFLRKHRKDFDKPLLDAFAAWETKTLTLLKQHALDPQIFESLVRKSTDQWESEMQERDSVIERARQNLNEMMGEYNKTPFPPQHEALPAGAELAEKK